MNYEIVSILDSVLGPHRKYANTEHYYHCPFCHHYNPKLAVNVQKGKWQCWKCGARGGRLLSLLRKLDVPRDIVQRLATLLAEEIPHAKTDQTQAILALPAEYRPLWEPSRLIEYRNAMRYLQNRGIVLADILRYQIGYCSEGMYANRVIVPSYEANGALNYFIGRDYYGVSSLKYMNPRVSKNIVGFENQINWNYPIVICEGVFDAMAIRRNAVPLLGKTLSKKLQEKIIQQKGMDIYLALDDDALKETIKLTERFMNEGMNVYLVDLCGKDPSDIGTRTMTKLIREAKKLSFYDLMTLKMRLV